VTVRHGATIRLEDRHVFNVQTDLQRSLLIVSDILGEYAAHQEHCVVPLILGLASRTITTTRTAKAGVYSSNLVLKPRRFRSVGGVLESSRRPKLVYQRPSIGLAPTSNGSRT